MLCLSVSHECYSNSAAIDRREVRVHVLRGQAGVLTSRTDSKVLFQTCYWSFQTPKYSIVLVDKILG